VTLRPSHALARGPNSHPQQRRAPLSPRTESVADDEQDRLPPYDSEADATIAPGIEDGGGDRVCSKEHTPTKLSGSPLTAFFQPTSPYLLSRMAAGGPWVGGEGRLSRF
jgi:hypothetical protein